MHQRAIRTKEQEAFNRQNGDEQRPDHAAILS
jgi:hypothetical protein